MKSKGANPNPVTDADVEAFHGYMRKWQARLNLCDWRVEPALTRSKYLADVSFDDGARGAYYRVGEHFGAEAVTPASLEATAVHELLHVLLRDLVIAASDRDASLEAQEHRVINVLEKLLMQSAG